MVKWSDTTDFRFHGQINKRLIILRCKRFATASTSTQEAAFPWRYDAELGTANSLHASA